MAWKLKLIKMASEKANSVDYRVLHSARRLINSTRRYFSCCDLCGSKIHTTQLMNYPLSQYLLCQSCINDLPYFNQSLVAGNLLNWPTIHQALPKIKFDYLFALSPYIYPFTDWLTQLKYSGRFEIANFFSAVLCAQWQQSIKNHPDIPIDLVISVPLHFKKWQQRGYNQSHLIAKHFAKHLALPYEANLVKREKNNASQMGKTGKQRRKNLVNAFSMQSVLSNNIKHVLIIDDVVTTGTTVSEISKLLKSAGVETITLVAICLALPKGNKGEAVPTI